MWRRGKRPVENRIEKRYRPVEFAFAELKGRRSKLGQIIDISKGGLALQYIDIGERPEELKELDIFISKNGFHLGDVKYKTVSDFKVTSNLLFSSIPMRRRGVQFQDLDDERTAMLDYFIQNYAVGEA